MMKLYCLGFLLSLISWVPGGAAVIDNPIAERIPQGDITVELKLIAQGLAAPLGAAFDGTGRMFIFDQTGLVRLVKNGTMQEAPFLDVRARLVAINANGDERGLLGLALHIAFATNGKVYTHTSEPVAGAGDFPLPGGLAPVHQEVIAEWMVSASNPDVIDPASRRELLRISEPQANHNGGTIAFGADGYLYIGLGDGGSGNDVGPGHAPEGNGQNLETPLGKILRIDVNGTNAANGRYGIPADNPLVGQVGLDEVYVFGMRNPYSFHFDPADGMLWVGDAGQQKIEEIDQISPATAGGNYGWRLKEGSFYFDPSNGTIVTEPVQPLPAGLIDPVAEYDHDDGAAVIGGAVYRGSFIPELAGRYVFGDFAGAPAGGGRLFYLDAPGPIKELKIGEAARPLGLWLKGFAQDRAGELYVFGSTNAGPSGTTGQVYKLIPLRNAAGHWTMY